MRIEAHLVRGAWLLLLVLPLWALPGCGLFEPPLSVAQAVARLIPFDPPVAQADHIIGDREIEWAVRLWVRGEPVPKTGGKRVDDAAMKQLAQLWAQQIFIP